MTQWSDHDWKQLAVEAQAGLKGQGAVVETMHRLTDRFDAFSASSDRYSKRSPSSRRDHRLVEPLTTRSGVEQGL
jgi:hypothetical protein